MLHCLSKTISFLCVRGIFRAIFCCALVFYSMSDIRGENFRYICSSVGEIKECLKQNIGEDYKNRDDILYTFDVDDTLIKLNHPLLPYLKEYNEPYEDLLRKYSRITEMDLRRYLASYVERTELGASEWLKSLTGKKIALTASPTGECADGMSMMECRYQELREKGITFEATTFNIKEPFDSDEPFKLEELAYEGQYPTYYKGILFSLRKSEGSPSKGTVLCTFLEKINYTPKWVVLIDDLKENLKSVQDELEKRYPDKINFIGILYTGANEPSDDMTGAKNDEPSDDMTEEKFKKDAEKLFRECYRKFNIPEPE